MDLSDAIGCPRCQGPLQAIGDPARSWHCSDCGGSFAVKDGMPVLFRTEDIDRFDEFSRGYREARLHDGWPPPNPEQARDLPHSAPRGHPPLYWEVRRQSFCALTDVLASQGPAPSQGPAADLGAGIGWLSYRLALSGYAMLAVDAIRDPTWGLGAAEHYYLPHAPFALAQGDLEHPPLQAGKLALIVMNASLHFATDLEGTLGRAARALQPNGRLAVLDTPIARRPQAGTGRGDRHLSREELDTAILASGLSPRWIPIHRGPRWWLHQVRVWLKRDPLFSFPMILANRSP